MGSPSPLTMTWTACQTSPPWSSLGPSVLFTIAVKATGALEGKTTTTYWRAADDMRGAGVTVEGARYVQVKVVATIYEVKIT